MTHRFKLPIRYFIDSLDIVWDAAGVPFVGCQANEPGRTGAVVYQMQADGSLREVLATGIDGWSKCRLKVRPNGTGCLIGADAHGTVSVWEIPTFKATP